MMSYEVDDGHGAAGRVPRLRHARAGRDRRAAERSCLSVDNFASSWGIFLQPLGFVLFFTAAIAETKRTPFDIPEGEPEIIGYFVEYSGMRFGMFFLGEFIEIVFLERVMITVFFGGWHLPAPRVDGFAGRRTCPTSLFVLADVRGSGLVKVFVFCAFQLLIRWSLPRFRSDQLMQLGWQRLLPLSLANVMVTALVILWRSCSNESRSQMRQNRSMAVGVKVVNRPGQPRASRCTCPRSPRGWASRSATS